MRDRMLPEPSPQALARMRRDDELVLRLSRRPPDEAAKYLTWEASGSEVIPALVVTAPPCGDGAGRCGPHPAAHAAGHPGSRSPDDELRADLAELGVHLSPAEVMPARASG
jgi:hypothetical protein